MGLQGSRLDMGSPVTQGSTPALPNSAPSTSTSDPKLKLSIILDPSLDSDVIRLPHSHVRGLFSTYARNQGAEPAEDVEPTVEQISAVPQVGASDSCPTQTLHFLVLMDSGWWESYFTWPGHSSRMEFGIEKNFLALPRLSTCGAVTGSCAPSPSSSTSPLRSC